MRPQAPDPGGLASLRLPPPWLCRLVSFSQQTTPLQLLPFTSPPRPLLPVDITPHLPPVLSCFPCLGQCALISLLCRHKSRCPLARSASFSTAATMLARKANSDKQKVPAALLVVLAALWQPAGGLR